MVVITSNKNHLIAKSASCKVIIPEKETDYKIGTFYSQFAFGFIFDAIYSVIYAPNYESNANRKKNIDKLADRQTKI